MFDPPMTRSHASPLLSSAAYAMCERAVGWGHEPRSEIQALARHAASLGPMATAEMFRLALGRLRFGAACAGRLDWIKELDRWGAARDVRDAHGACCLAKAAERDFLDIVGHIVRGEPRARDRLDRSGASALHRALRFGCVGSARLLISLGMDPALRDGHGRDALSWAAGSMSSEMAAELLPACDPWSQDLQRLLPLHRAAAGGQESAARLLAGSRGPDKERARRCCEALELAARMAAPHTAPWLSRLALSAREALEMDGSLGGGASGAGSKSL